ncbi:39S ribosomal protein L19, mitochondrial-like [Paramacrobiotus metropolitanus]|uniref:39S ribosomal protein L19, mitochondrial-like n=1 Tax=Paramacrobiotus metropolitanus TaxID=2943436 RepID=UPI002445DCC2|nr:39S ribosomal protein L19, mitochondrial-like [Paramacrobiotus metropolitanus]
MNPLQRFTHVLLVRPHNLVGICRRSESILASKSARAVLKKDEKDVEVIPPLSQRTPEIPASFRFIYPEFLPNIDPKKRNYLSEKLERQDMMRRRTQLHIPEFYPGSIMAVTTSDPHSPTKTNRFVGICLYRGCPGLESCFVLRNHVDGTAVEIKYHMYNPTVRKIEVLRLERRLDDQLFYLRDAPAEFSTFPFDLDYQPHPEGAPIPLNETVVKLNPLPWTTRWEQYAFKGLVFDVNLPNWRSRRTPKTMAPHAWERFDLMKKYRKQIVLEDQEIAFKDVFEFNNGRFEKRKPKEK